MGIRLNFLDYAKAVGIIGVIFGHVFGFNNVISIWFFSFHVPLFFIVSGILVSKNNMSVKQIFLKNIKVLIIPYIWFSIPFIIYEIYKSGTSVIGATILKLISGYGIGALWFLPTLFISLTLFRSLLNRLNKYLIYIISTVIFILPFLVSTNNIFAEVLLRSCTALGFITFGYFISQWIKTADIELHTAILFLVINVIATIFNGAVDLYDLNYGNPLLYTIQGITGTLAIISLFKSIKLKNDKLLSYIGVNTLSIMATHQILLIIINQVISNNTIVFILTLVVEIPIVYLINNYTPWVLGKFKRKRTF